MSSPTPKVTAPKKKKEAAKDSNECRIETIISLLDSMKVSELIALEEKLREKFQLDQIQMNIGGGGSKDTAEVKKVSLLLEDIGTLSQIQALKVVNKALKLSVSEAKNVLLNLPYTILKNVEVEEAENKKNEINEMQEGLVLTIS